MIEIKDNILETHVAQLIDSAIHNVDFKWHWHHKANKNEPDRHWHTLAGHTVGEVQENGFDFLLPLWDIISNYDPKVEIIKAYFNAHTSGVEPSINLDDDDMTFIYYSNMTWNMNYGGETTIYDDDFNKGTIIPYKGNRLIGFTASKQHQAMPVSKKCFMLRTCVVFKTKFIKE